ncbi:hypothetical protein D3C73_907660 [compost metagenome]
MPLLVSAVGHSVITADGLASHAEGFMARAFGAYSHAEGENTIVAPGYTGSHIMGHNGTTRFPYSWHLANGLRVGPTLNSAVIEGATGNLYLDGTVISPAAADYAEMFETADGQAIEPVLNPDWNASLEYIPRNERDEWVAVGIVGKLLVRDDGSCQPGGYCTPNDEGIATAAEAGYRVMNRTRDDQIRIFVK